MPASFFEMSLPHEIALYKQTYVLPKQRAYEIALTKEASLARSMRAAYVSALTRYGLYLNTHPLATSKDDEPPYADEFREALSGERDWVQDELNAVEHGIYR
jgi:hypothetical protein